jgi:hypothetical protein
MPDENKSNRSTRNQSGGVTINAHNVTITGNVAGRDNTTESNANASGSGSTSPSPHANDKANNSRALFAGGLIGFVVGVAGNLLANLLWEEFFKQAPAWAQLASISLMTLAGLLGAVWIEKRSKPIGILALVCSLGSIAVVIFAAMSPIAPPPNPHAPIIQKVMASPSTVHMGETATLTAVATDPDNDDLVFYWKAQKGSVPSGAQGDTVTYTASGSSGIETIEVTVSDGQSSASETIRVSVLSR